MEKPENLDKLLEYSRILSEEFSYVRVDFATDDEDIHVVEMTFTPQSAMIPFNKKDADIELGKLLKI